MTFLPRSGHRTQLPEDAVFDFNLAVDEVFTNIVQHGYADQLDH